MISGCLLSGRVTLAKASSWDLQGVGGRASLGVLGVDGEKLQRL